MIMYCKNCFRKISSTSKFCRYCGAPVKGDKSITEKQLRMDAIEDTGHAKDSQKTDDSGKVYEGMRSGRSGKTSKFPVPPIIIGAIMVIVLLAASITVVTKSSVFQKGDSISFKEYVGVWQERGSNNIEENGGVRLKIHGIDADTLIISMEFYGVVEDDIFVNELGAVVKDGKAYYSFTNDGHGNSGNGVLTFNGRDIEWKSTVNKEEPFFYTVSKVTYSDNPGISDPQDEPSAPEQQPEETEQDDAYILPNSDKAYVTEDELKGLTQEELRIARNEIMARHGRIFRDPTLDAYFRSKDWYEPTMEPDTFDSQSGSILNNYETKNIALIKQMEE